MKILYQKTNYVALAGNPAYIPCTKPKIDLKCFSVTNLVKTVLSVSIIFLFKCNHAKKTLIRYNNFAVHSCVVMNG